MILIDADFVRERFGMDRDGNCCNCKKVEHNCDYEVSLMDVCCAIDDAPTIEAEPVRHGYWIEMERGHYFKCSNCRNPIPYKFGWKLCNGITNKRNYNFCPNCGAKMDEVTE